MTVSSSVEEVKTSSSKWLKTQGPEFSRFAWQTGYGAFSVSESNVTAVRDYIANQAEHHRVKSFQEEYLAFLTKHGVAFDERYFTDEFGEGGRGGQGVGPVVGLDGGHMDEATPSASRKAA